MMVLLLLPVMHYTIAEAMAATQTMPTPILNPRGAVHNLTLPLTEPEGGLISIDLPHSAASNFCTDVPPQIDDSKNSFPLHITIGTQPRTLPVRDETAVEFCHEIRQRDEGLGRSVPSSTATTSVSRTGTSITNVETATSSRPQSSDVAVRRTTALEAHSFSLSTSDEANPTSYSGVTQSTNTTDPSHTTKMHPLMEGVHSALRTATPTVSSTTEHLHPASSSSAATRPQLLRFLRQLAPACWHISVRQHKYSLEAGVLECDETANVDSATAIAGGENHASPVGTGEPQKLEEWRFGEAYDGRIRFAIRLGWTTFGEMVLVAVWNFAKFAWRVRMPQVSKSCL